MTDDSILQTYPKFKIQDIYGGVVAGRCPITYLPGPGLCRSRSGRSLINVFSPRSRRSGGGEQIQRAASKLFEDLCSRYRSGDRGPRVNEFCY